MTQRNVSEAVCQKTILIINYKAACLLWTFEVQELWVQSRKNERVRSGGNNMEDYATPRWSMKTEKTLNPEKQR